MGKIESGMSLSPQRFYDFGPFRLHPSEQVLLRNGQPVSLPPKAFDLLNVLVDRAGRLVTKEELLKEVWPGTFVEEANLSYTVSLVRKALGDDTEPHAFIETVSKRGYRFKAVVVRSAQRMPADEAHARRPVRWLVGAVGLLLLLAAALWLVADRRQAETPPMLARLQLVSPQGVTVENAQISPDGRRIAFIGRERDAGKLWGLNRRLWIQRLDSGVASVIPGTDGASNPFWAPDSQQVGFFADGALKRINLSGGPAQTLCLAAEGGGGSWSRGDVVLYRTGPFDPIYQVSASGGVSTPATSKPDRSKNEQHFWPQFLPDGRHFLFVVKGSDKQRTGLYVGSLDSYDVKRLLETETPAIYRAPYLVYSRDGAIVAQPFDLTRLEPRGRVVPITDDVANQAGIGPPQFSTALRSRPGFNMDAIAGLFGAATFSASETGVIVYSLVEPYQYQFGWFNEVGTPLADVGSPGTFYTFDLSHDGKKVIVARVRLDRANLWVLDLEGARTFSQISFGSALEFDPRWAPDGRIALTSTENGVRRIVERGSDGKETVLLAQPPALLDDWSRGGRFLLYRFQGIFALPLFGERKPILVRRPNPDGLGFDQSSFSPDNHLIAYQCGDSGRFEVYVERFPPTGARHQISLEGGVQPMWRSDSKELYYLGLDGTLYAAEIRGTDGQGGISRPLFRPPVGFVRYEVEQYATIDGKRFLVQKPINRQQRPVDVVQNWPAAVKQELGVGKR